MHTGEFLGRFVYVLGENIPRMTGLSGSKMPFCTSTSLLARNDIFRSSAVNKKRKLETRMK